LVIKFQMRTFIQDKSEHMPSTEDTQNNSQQSNNGTTSTSTTTTTTAWPFVNTSTSENVNRLNISKSENFETVLKNHFETKEEHS